MSEPAGDPVPARGLYSLAYAAQTFFEGLGPRVDIFVDQTADVLESSSELMAGTNKPAPSSPDKSADSRLWIRRLLEHNAELEAQLQTRPPLAALEDAALAVSEVNAVADSLDETRARNDALQEDIAHLQSRLREAQSRAEALDSREQVQTMLLSQALSEAQALASELAALKRQAAAQQRANGVLELRVRDLEASLSALHGQPTEEDAILLKPPGQVAAETQLSRHVEESLALKRQIDQLLTDKLNLVAQLERASASEASDASSAQRDKADAEHWRAQAQSLEAALISAVASEKERALAAQQRRDDDAQAALRAAKQLETELEAERGQARQAREDAARALAEAQARRDALEREVAGLKNVDDDGGAKEALRRLRGELDGALAERSQLASQLSSAQAEAQSARAGLEAELVSSTSLRAQVETAHASALEAEAQARSFLEQAAEARRHGEAAQQAVADELAGARAALDAARAERAAAAAEAARLRSECEATAGALAREQTRFATLMDQLAETHKDAQQLPGLRAELAAAREASETGAARLREAQAEARAARAEAERLGAEAKEAGEHRDELAETARVWAVERDAAQAAQRDCEARLAESARDCEALGAQMIRLQVALDDGLGAHERGLRARLTEAQATAQAAVDELALVRAELEAVAGRERLARAGAGEAEAQALRLEAALAEASGVAKARADESAALRAAWEAERARERAANTSADDAHALVDAAEARARELEAALAEKGAALEAARQVAEERAQALRASGAALEAAQTKHERAVAAVKADAMEAARKAAQELKARVRELEGALADKEAAALAASRQAAARLGAVERELAGATQGGAEAGRLKAEADATRAVVESMAADKAELEARLAETRRECVAAEAAREAAAREAEAAQRRAQAAEAERQTLRERAARSHQLMLEALADKELVEVDLFKARSDVAALEREVVAQQQVMELIQTSAQEDDRQLKERLRVLSGEIARHRALREEAQAELKKFGAAVLGQTGAAKVHVLLAKLHPQGADDDDVKRRAFAAWRADAGV